MSIKKVIRGDKAVVKIWTEDVDSASLDQLLAIASLPFIHKHVAAMPDVHLGKGATVGSVIPQVGAIIPAAVGVDIGCGMTAARLSMRAEDLPDSLLRVREFIEAKVPLGTGAGNTKAMISESDPLIVEYRKIVARNKDFGAPPVGRVAAQLGSLGSGNHFIEVCLDEDDRVWVMLHSGSRGVGNKIGSYFISEAKREMDRYFIRLPDRDLAYFPERTDGFDRYVEAVDWAQRYAKRNRDLLLSLTLAAMHNSGVLPQFNVTDEIISAHHNYVALENHYGHNVWITRKGAIRARERDLGIIPGSMGDRSYIVRGLGNPDSFCSCSHGAGRRFSRSEAKRRFDVEDLVESTRGIECRKDTHVLDEIPRAYKPINEVMENQSDLVEVVHTLKQVLNVKG